MVTEFLCGGDLFTHLEVHGRFTLEQTIFYMAELLEGLDCVHKSGFVHRDIKPDNMILTMRGHLKLLDFGLCKQDSNAEIEAVYDSVGARRHRNRTAAVGTPPYMSPESFVGEVGPGGDIWAVGVITFECLFGCNPFQPANIDEVNPKDMLQHVRANVENYEDIIERKLKKAQSKKDNRFTPEAENFVLNVLCSLDTRLTMEECRQHDLFKGVNFDLLHMMKPPITPKVSGPGDISNFEKFRLQPLPVDLAFIEDSTLGWAHYDRDCETHEMKTEQDLAGNLRGF